jgi:acyl carrier protein
LEALPRNSNGKVDKKALPDPEGLGIHSGVAYEAPRNELEKQMVKIWEELLGKAQIGIRDNFFNLGGHSLKAIQLISRINATFSVRINIVSLFTDPTIESLCEQIHFIQHQEKKKMHKEHLIQVEL